MIRITLPDMEVRRFDTLLRTDDIQFGFFESLLKLPEHQQEVVFVNKEPLAWISLRLKNIHNSGRVSFHRRFAPLEAAAASDMATKQGTAVVLVE